MPYPISVWYRIFDYRVHLDTMNLTWFCQTVLFGWYGSVKLIIYSELVSRHSYHFRRKWLNPISRVDRGQLDSIKLEYLVRIKKFIVPGELIFATFVENDLI